MSTAALLATDTATKGDWPGVYGADGGGVPGGGESDPAYVTVTQTGFSDYNSYHPTTSPQPFKITDHTTRVPDVWFGDPFTLQLQFTDGQAHQVALYYFADGNTRQQTVEIRDADNGDSLLDTHTFSSANGSDPSGFAVNPFWYVYQFTGNIKVKHIKVTGPNAVLSAFLFDTPASFSPKLSRVRLGYMGFSRTLTGF